MKFSIKDFFSKCDQLRTKLRICSHLLKKSLMEKFIFCVVSVAGWQIQLFNSTGAIVQELLPRLLKSRRYNSSTVSGKILRQSLVRFFNGQDNLCFLFARRLFNSGVHCWRIVLVFSNEVFDKVILLVQESYNM